MSKFFDQDLDHVLAYTGDVWEALRGARIFITGGTGFFGRWMLETFLWANERLKLDATAIVLTRDALGFRRKAAHLAEAVEVIQGDIRTFPFPPEGCTRLIHLATDTDSRHYEEDPLAMLDTIIEGTRRALDCAVACGARSFLLASSGAVYGRQPADLSRIPEDFCGGPDQTLARSTYGEAKRMAELLGCLYAERRAVPVKIARCFAFVGPGLPLDQHFAIGNFIGDVLGKRPIVIRGDGTALRSYLYAADLAIWLWTMLVRAEPGRAYNAGSGDAVSIADLARLVSKTLNADAEIRVTGTPAPGSTAERYVPSVERAENELGLMPWIGLEDAIRRTAAWHRAKA